MKRRNFIKTTLMGAGVSLFPTVLFGQSNKLPNVLILGDSISIGYTKYVQKILQGIANVKRPIFLPKGNAENCQGTKHGLKRIDEWIGDTKWDVIHFNFGLHDLKHVDAEKGKNSDDPNDPQQSSPKEYKKNLTEIVKKLKATGAKLVFATTTPYPDKPRGPLRRSDQPAIYNKIALKIMKKNDIKINNLHDFVLPRIAEIQLPSNVHFSKDGSKVLARQVANNILTALK